MRHRLVDIVLNRGGLIELPTPVELASGDLSRHFVDVKRAFSAGADLRLACDAFIEVAAEMTDGFDAVGGLTMGADSFAHGIAVVAEVDWFSVRKKAKDRGTRKRIEGASLGSGCRALLVDDVVTRGGSIGDALAEIRLTGAEVVAAVSLVDRGTFGQHVFDQERVPYRALLTYLDLGIPAVGDEPGATASTG